MKMVNDNLRDDVIEFSKLMSEVMDLKAISTKEERAKPNYKSNNYSIDDANLDMGKQCYYLQQAIIAGKFDTVKKRAIHVANYCMIIYNKLNLDKENVKN